MVIGRTSQRSERRRRVLSEERRNTVSTEGLATNGSSSRGERRDPRRYSAAAQRDRQMFICDLIPQRPWAVLIWCLLGSTFVAGHAAFESLCQWLQSRHVPIDLSPIRLGLSNSAGRSTLSTLSVSLTLMIAAGYAALVLNFRRHRTDDYRGRYRLWYYVCGGLLVAGVLTGSGLTRTLSSTALELSDASRLAPHAGWLIAAAGLLGAAGLIRLVIEMRGARGAVAPLLGATLLVVGSALLDAPSMTAYGEEFQQCLRTVFHLAAAQLLLLSMVIYARHVYLAAQGQDIRRARSPWPWRTKLKLKRKPAAESSDADDARTPAKKLAVRRPPEPARSDQSSDADEDEDEEQDTEDQPATVKLSRAERRRQAKEKRRHQRAA